MVFIGMDHGTTGISFCIMSDKRPGSGESQTDQGK